MSTLFLLLLLSVVSLVKSDPIFLLPFSGDFIPFFTLAEALAEKGHETYILLPNENKDWLNGSKVKFIRLPFSFNKIGSNQIKSM